MNIIKKLQELNLPFGEYVVIGSGILAALNLREANDLDIAVTEKLFNSLKNNKNFKNSTKHNEEFLIGDDVEVISRLNWDHYPTTIEMAITSAMTINNFPFLNIEETIKFKTALGREKDFKDIKLLKNYLKQNTSKL